MNLNILPQPQLIENYKTEFYFPDEIIVSLPKLDETKDSYLIKYINSFLANKFEISENNEDANIVLNLDDEFVPGNAKLETISDAYSLKMVDSRIVITARTYRGVFYGLVTLKKILNQNTSGELNELQIIDFPDFQFRGISDDISRGQVSTLNNFKRIIDFLAENKMNTYMPYIEDVLAFDRYPTIGKNRGALTKAEARELVAYAKSKFVDIIPVFQTLGHYENILSKDEFIHLAEFPGAASLDVSNPDIYEFLDNLLKEVTDVFPGEYIHVGADESFDVGWGNSKQIVETSSIAEVHAEHYKKIYNLCKKYNRKMMMYGDIILRHPEILDMIPHDITIVDWHYGARSNYTSAKTFKDAGFHYIVSPSVWNFLTTYPANLNAIANIKYLVKSGLTYSSIGMINSNWGDYGAETFKEFLYYGYAWSAQCAWSFNKSNINKFTQTFFIERYGLFTPEVMLMHTTLSNPLNQVLWHEIWRHPLLGFKQPAWWEPQVDASAKLEWLKMTVPGLQASVSRLKSKIKKNRSDFEIIDFLTKLYKWYTLKMETVLELQDTTISLKDRKKKIISMIDENIVRLGGLKIEYKQLWKKFYKSDNLNMIEDKFDRLIQYFTETKDQLKNSDTLYSPILNSKWIYAEEGDIKYKEAVFEYNIELQKPFEEIKLQLLGDNYAELYINDEYVDRVFARRTLSLSVEYKRIKYLNIGKYFKEGENEIKVIVKNFNPRLAAGFNIISRIKYPDGEIDYIKTNSNWKYRIPGNQETKTPVEKDYRYTVIAPNFDTDRTSWIER